MFIVPKSSLRFNEFRFKYIEKKDERRTTNLYKKINENEYVFVSNYDPVRKRGTNFSLEHFVDNKLKFKILSNSIRWIEENKNFRLFGYSKRYFSQDDEQHISKSRIDTIFNFKIENIPPGTYEVIAWQEKFKMTRSITKTVEIKGNSDTVEDFLFIKPEKK